MMQGEVELHPTDPQKLSGSALLLGSPDEMEDEECGSACCRICLDENNDSGGGGGGYELISPCTCKGTQKFVHRSCLHRWRSVNDGGFAFSNCTTCSAQLHIPDEPFDDNVSAWDVFLMWQFAAALMGLLTYMMDIHGNFRRSLENEQFICILAKHPILFYYSLGSVIIFGMFGVFSLVIRCGNDPRIYGWVS
ncbi:uncharacterized protein LOC108807472 [Raphanus sativus]|uniref:Uncharacterized protein LOC108807472 n=1 Tax=Raphanus sativus TaxID=3726 RepID=A0A9W3DFY4_RAPSA|nr:uncharacterized protein LOC108807472 [Raphanus sativus]